MCRICLESASRISHALTGEIDADQRLMRLIALVVWSNTEGRKLLVETSPTRTNLDAALTRFDQASEAYDERIRSIGLAAATAHTPRTAALTHLLVLTGLRISEALNAAVTDLGHRTLAI